MVQKQTPRLQQHHALLIVSALFVSYAARLIKKQMAYMLSRQGVRPDIEEELDRIMDGTHQAEHYQVTA